MSAGITEAMVEAAAKVISPQAWKERLWHLERAEHWERIAVNDTQRSLIASHRENAISVVQQSLQTARESLAAALSTEPGEAEGWQPTHRHKKRGSTYRVVAEGRLQTGNGHLVDMHPMTIYQGEDGAFWVRAAHEFHDGRFEVLPAAPLPEDIWIVSDTATDAFPPENIRALLDELSRLREALKPFAAIADEYADQEDDDFQVWKDFDVLGATLPLKHFRAARRVLSEREGQADGK